jgi:hypothetical protein
LCLQRRMMFSWFVVGILSAICKEDWRRDVESRFDWGGFWVYHI